MRGQRGTYRKSYIVPHGRGFKYLRAIPKDLQPLERKCAWVKCLGAISRAEAETQAHALAYEHRRRIVALRALSDDERRAITVATLEKEAGLGEIASRHVEVGTGLEPDVEAEEGRQIKARRALIETCPEIFQARTTQNRVTGQGAGGGLMSLVELWEKIKQPRNCTTTQRARLCVRRFIKLVGDLEPHDVTRAHVIAYRDALETLPGMSAQNIAEHLARLHTLFNVALSEGLVTTNPAYRVKARMTNGKLADGRRGFTSEHVRRIFDVLDGETEEFKWVVRLLAYHGMRSGEACQLRCEDVTTLHGIHVLRIHDRYGSLKNRASVRDIPIHLECMGILEYAREAASKHGTESWLFASLPVKKRGRAHWFQDYGGSKFLRRKVCITDSRYTMHSFRHLWRTLARECEMPESVSRSIMGHALGRGEHGAYGSAPSLKLRAQWIAKIDLLKA